MLTIALGSVSEDKNSFLKEFLHKHNLRADIRQLKVDSGISDQPLSQEETLTGSTNRARSAFSLLPSADLALGMEGGLCLQPHSRNYSLICAVTLIDKHQKSFIGISHPTRLPKIVSDSVKSGSPFGTAIRNYQSDQSDPEKLKLARHLISRKSEFFQALYSAFSQYLPDHSFSL